MVRRAAIANLALHTAALALAATAMRPGSPLATLDERRLFLAQAPLGWSVGWAFWALAALALVGFLAAVDAAASTRATRFGLVLATAGVAIDLFCDTCHMVALPLAARDAAIFPAAERALWSGGLVAANGLYSLGILAFTLGLRDRVPPRVTALGLATFAGGMIMVVAGLTFDANHIGAGTAFTMAAFYAWVIDLARAPLAR
jgi:hypothetical protein